MKNPVRYSFIWLVLVVVLVGVWFITTRRTPSSPPVSSVAHPSLAATSTPGPQPSPPKSEALGKASPTAIAPPPARPVPPDPAAVARRQAPALAEKLAEKLDEELREKPAYDQPNEAMEYYRQKRLPSGATEIPVEKYLAAKAQMDAMPQYSSAQNRYLPSRNEMKANRSEAAPEALGTWTSLGPGNVGGRTRALLIHPTTPNVMYAAGVAGGVWKSTNSGASWQPLTDLMANIAVSCLAFDPSNPNVIYAGTGEGFFNGNAVRGAGIFRTTDGGTNWTQLTATGTSDFYYVNDLVISKANSQRMYAGTRTGVWRSLDGGATWTSVLSYTDGCLDLVMRTDQTNDYVFAACGSLGGAEVFRNTDAAGAGTWTSVLKESGMGRTSLALAPSNQNIVYAAASSVLAGTFRYGLHAVFRSTNSGESGSWTAQVRNNNTLKLNTLLFTNPLGAFRAECGLGASSFSNQGWYDNVIAVDPLDETKVWVGGIDLFRSDDSGMNWGLASYWWPEPNTPQYAHADQHVIAFHPQYNGGSNKQMFIGTDGGLFRTDDARALVSTGLNAACNPAASGMRWTSLNNNYGVTQFYHGAVFPDGKSYFGGTQDNGTLLGTDASGANGWREIWGGDGGYVAIDPTNPNVMYASTPFGGFRKSTDGGRTFADATFGITGDSPVFIAPLTIDASDPQRLWTGGRKVWKTENGGANWKDAGVSLFSPATAIGVSPIDSSAVLVGTQSGHLHYGYGAIGASAYWQIAFPRSGFVSSVTFGSANRFDTYATYSTFGGSHVWRGSGSSAWVPIDGTGANRLPDIPVHCLVIDPTNPARLFVGTDLGVFVTTDRGVNWAIENTGFANAPVEWLALQTINEEVWLYAFSHGRGVWRVRVGTNPCSYFLSASQQSFEASGGTGTVTVMSGNGCNWTAETQYTGFLTIINKTANSVTFRVDASDTELTRSGTITIAGKSFLVTQKGVGKKIPAPLASFIAPANTNVYRTTRNALDILALVSGVSQTYRHDRGGNQEIAIPPRIDSVTFFSVNLPPGQNNITLKADNGSAGKVEATLTVDSQPVYNIEPLAGLGTQTADGVPARDTLFKKLTGLFIAEDGTVYLSDTLDHRVRKIRPDGTMQTIAGTGTQGFSGDGGTAIAATLNSPRDVTVDKTGNIYISDNGNNRIRKVTPDGLISTLVGNGQTASQMAPNEEIGEGVPPSQVRLLGVASLFVDRAGNLVFADNFRIRRLTISDGLVRTFIGNGRGGDPSGNGGPATNATMLNVTDAKADNAGNFYTAEMLYLRRMNNQGIIHAFASEGWTRFNFRASACEAEDVTRNALQNCIYVGKLAIDSQNRVYSLGGGAIWRIDQNHNLEVLYGGSERATRGNPDVRPAHTPMTNLALDKAENIYFTSETKLYRLVPVVTEKVRPELTFLAPTTDTIWTTTQSTFDLQCQITDNQSVSQAILRTDRGTTMIQNAPSDWVFKNVPLRPGINLITVTAWDAAGNMATKTLTVTYNPLNSLTTIAGTRSAGFNLESGSSLTAQLYLPEAVVPDGAGNLYIADTGNHRIRKVTRTGQISTVAGNGQLGSSGDGGLAVNAALNQPNGVAVDSSGNVYFSDTNNHRIRRVNAAGIISTIAGRGLPGFSGDGGAAVQAEFNSPVGVTLDGAGNLLIADAGNHRIRQLNLSSGLITTIAGNGYGSGGDGGQATQAQFNFPTSVARDSSGNLYIADTSNHVVRRVSAAGVISRFAGTGTAGFGGDGGTATAAQFNAPGGLTLDASGNVYITDQTNHRVRKVATDGTVTTVAGNGQTSSQTSDEGGVALNATLNAPAGVAVDAAGNLFIADTNNHRVVVVAAYKSAATVSAATYAATQPVAAESIVSVFGANLATRDQAVTQLPLPTELAGTSVKVRDSLGVERLAPLFYVGKLQVNYQIPAGTAAGFATVTITNGIGEIFTSAVNITAVTPGLFTATQNGTGAAAAAILYFRNGTPRYESSFACDAQGQNCTARQIDLSAGDEVFLELYGTGLRNNSGLANVTATVGGVAVPVLYANKQPDFIGLDQVNVRLPKTLAGRGEVDLLLTVDGKAANPVKVNLK